MVNGTLQINRDNNNMKDAVNPHHYKNHPSGVEAITIAEHMGFSLGNSFKYLFRCGSKGQALEDLKKAHWYLERESLRAHPSRLREWLYQDYSVAGEGSHAESLVILNEDRYSGHMASALMWICVASACKTLEPIRRARESVERMIEIEQYRQEWLSKIQ